MNNKDEPIIPVGPNTAKLMEKIAAEGNESAEFTKEEKLALVADGLMNPKEVGLTTQEEAQLQILPEAQQVPKFGDGVKFECGVVPIALRAQWALEENKIIMPASEKDAWIEKWIEENKNTFRIQGYMHCGTALARFERTFRDPILGLANMLHLAGEMLEKQYTGKSLPTLTDKKPTNVPEDNQPQKPA